MSALKTGARSQECQFLSCDNDIKSPFLGVYKGEGRIKSGSPAQLQIQSSLTNIFTRSLDASAYFWAVFSLRCQGGCDCQASLRSSGDQDTVLVNNWMLPRRRWLLRTKLRLQGMRRFPENREGLRILILGCLSSCTWLFPGCWYSTEEQGTVPLSLLLSALPWGDCESHVFSHLPPSCESEQVFFGFSFSNGPKVKTYCYCSYCTGRNTPGILWWSILTADLTVFPVTQETASELFCWGFTEEGSGEPETEGLSAFASSWVGVPPYPLMEMSPS